MKKKNEVRELVIEFPTRSHHVRVWHTMDPRDKPSIQLMAGLVTLYRSQALPAEAKGMSLEEIARAIYCNCRKIAAVEVKDNFGHGGMVLYPDWS